MRIGCRPLSQLMDRATRAGYIAAVTLDRRHATAADAISASALPRPGRRHGGAIPGAARRPGMAVNDARA